MLRLKDDLLTLMNAAVDGQLAHSSVRWHDEAALTVVLAAKGDPAAPEKGSVFSGVVAAGGAGVEIFHAGTALDGGGRLVAAGGRVLAVTACGPSVGAAQASAYAAVDRIDWPQGFCRRDIGWRAIEREKAAG